MVVICAALGVGVWSLFSALPTPTALPDLAAEGGAVAPSVVPRMATIPWKRDPQVLPGRAFKEVQIPLPGARPKPVRGVPSWWTPPVGMASGVMEAARESRITWLLKSQEAGEQMQGIAGIEDMIRENPVAAARNLVLGQSWCGALLEAKRGPDLDRVASAVMVPVAFNVDLLEGLGAARTEAVLFGETKEQEVRLREWWAICSLHGTVPVMKQALRLLRVKLPLENFAVDPEGEEAKRFAAAARGMDGEDYASLLSRANLWLLGGKADLAEAVFRRAYMVAPESQVEAAAENFARVVKARTGSVEETNKWLQEHGK